MKAVLQRVKQSQLSVENKLISQIKEGLVILVSVGKNDAYEDVRWLGEKILKLRIFSSSGKMNKSIQDVEGDILVVSQFTLHANTKKGRRPSFEESAPPEQALSLFNALVDYLKKNYSGNIATGMFGQDMTIDVTLRGPVTILLNSKISN